LYLQGKENIRQRYYAPAEENLKACLQKDPNYMPALTDYAMLLYRNMKYQEALVMAKKALSIDTYDPAANY
jgi:tetratricopeptide (TPR) repeat protein